MNKILVLGSNGQLGSEIKELSFELSEYEFLFTSKQILDITNFSDVNNFIISNSISIIINCSAYTAVDKAENEKELSNLVNNLAVKNLAKISKERNLKLIHISTDYVFDGNNYIPYKESDIPNPKSQYGKTKLEGENAIININPLDSVIIRTSWVYSNYGNNFVKTMCRLSKEKDELSVICDQIGTPTYAKDLALVIIKIIPLIKNNKVEILNYTSEGIASWYDFSKAIFENINSNVVIHPIHTSEYKTLAKRPYFSVLNKEKIKSKYNIVIPYWKDSLKECLKNYKS
jgi:dTDP-4-dehydrorhamnose reductase